jgi:hypothetical protein
MKVLLATLVISAAMTSLLIAVDHGPGLHSTSGIWLALPNLPGLTAVSWAHALAPQAAIWNDGPLPWFVCGLVNWIAYFGAAKAAIAARRKFAK